LYLSILRFELSYQLRRPAFYICLLAAIIFSIALVTGMAEIANTAQRQIHMNSPVMMARLLTIFVTFGLIVPVVIFGNAVLRDRDNGMEPLVKAAPVGLSGLLLARFLAAFIAVNIIFLTLPPSVELALHMPWIDPMIVGPLRPSVKLQLYAIVCVVNLFVFSSFLFAALCWTRSFAAGYLVVAVFVALVIIVSRTTLKHPLFEYGALADPFGLATLNQIIRYWPPVDQNERAIPLEGLLLWNRLIWSGAALLLLAATVLLLPRRVKGAKPRINERAALLATHRPRVLAAKLECAGFGAQFFKRLRYETGCMFKSWSFYLFLALLIGTTFSYLRFPDPEVLQPFFPIPAMIAPRIAAMATAWGTLFVLMITGETVWRERQSRISEILDATPTSNFTFFAAKLGAITIALTAFMMVAIAVGMLFQFRYGAPDLQFGVYAIYGYLFAGIPLVMFSVVALLIHVLAPGKFIGHIAAVSFLVAQIVAQYWGVENKLILFGSLPTIPISVMNGLGHYVYSTIWHAIYWGGITVLVAVAVHLLWVRGQNTSIRARLASIPVIEKKWALAASLVAVLSTSSAGVYIFWNVHIRHGYYTARGLERGQADYERKFGRFVAEAQPQVTDIELAVDVDPGERTFAVRGQYDLVNRTGEPIETIRVQFYDELRRDMVELEGADLDSFDPMYADYIFRPRAPLAPGAKLKLKYAGRLSDAGFKHSPLSSINDNGTLIRSGLFAPSIGVLPTMFLTDEARRQKHGLSNHLQVIYRTKDRNLLSHDADLVNLKLTVSTSSDQTAIAPGVLKKRWVEGARNFFHYETDHPIRNFWIIQSGRYEALRGRWRDVDLEVYHDVLQGQKAPRMLEAMRESLDYYTSAFGPFQFRQLRIAEFPYSVIAQSFPSVIAYAEAGFITTPYQAELVDFTGFVTAHEVAHQWWGHQVVPADMPGAQFLSETLAEYSALMVMEKIHGADHIRSFLKKDLDDYLVERANAGREVPLSEVDSHQPHIAYKKGALAMYALKEAVGETVINRALRRYLETYRNRPAPYPVAKDLIAVLREESGPAHEEFISDLFERMTFWDFTAYTAFATPLEDGKWKVTLSAGGQKLDADHKGAETPIQLDDVVDVGLFAVSPADQHFGSQHVIQIEKRRVTSSLQSFEFVTDRRPEFAAINPYLTLMERNVGDNIHPVTLMLPPKP
jgi:ABC-2 type transport system permease protein